MTQSGKAQSRELKFSGGEIGGIPGLKASRKQVRQVPKRSLLTSGHFYNTLTSFRQQQETHVCLTNIVKQQPLCLGMLS